MTELKRLRDKIDEIDGQIMKLLEQRMRLSKEVGEYKDANNIPILDEKREEEIIQSRVSMLSDPSFAESAEALFRLVMRYSCEYQRKDRQD